MPICLLPTYSQYYTMNIWKNTFWHGLAWGIVLPVLAWFIIHFLDNWLISINAFGKTDNPWQGFKPSTLGLIAICINLLPAIFANRRYMEDFIRGLMFPTVLGAFGWLFYYDPLKLFGAA